MKEIKLTNAEIGKIVELLDDNNSLLNTKDISRSLPMKVIWKLQTNYVKLAEINRKSYEVLDGIKAIYFDDKHTQPQVDKNGNPTGQIEVKMEYRQEYFNKLVELDNCENEIQISTIPFEVLEDYKLTGAELKSIKWMVDDPVDDDEIEKVSGEVE